MTKKKARKLPPPIAPAPSCPYCGQQAQLKSSTDIYANGADYGPMWACMPCQAWVGCHIGTTVPLGRLANAELRRMKQSAHRAFDPLWMKGYMKRSDAYAWLAEKMGLTLAECHIGKMDEEQCGQVLQLCQPEKLPEIHKIRGEGWVASVAFGGDGRVKYIKGNEVWELHGFTKRSVQIRCGQHDWLVEQVTCESLLR